MITNVKKIYIGWALRYHNRRDYKPALKWCLQNISENAYNGKECPLYGKIPFSYEFHKDYLYLTFGREKDVMVFILRWA